MFIHRVFQASLVIQVYQAKMVKQEYKVLLAHQDRLAIEASEDFQEKGDLWGHQDILVQKGKPECKASMVSL
jgi:hypothetical protein